VGQSFTTQFLWGNLDTANNAGWGLVLRQGNGNVLELHAELGAAGAVAVVSYPLTGQTAINAVLTPIERAIIAGIWTDGTTLLLTVNGVIAAFGAAGGVMSPSALPARLGAGEAAVPISPAGFCDIISCGFFNELSFAGALVTIGQLAATGFDAARGSANSGYIEPSLGIDWVHRYEVASASRGLGATIQKSPAGARLTGVAAAPATMSDLGGQGIGNLNVNTATALNKVGPSTYIVGRKNLDWASFGAFDNTPAP
jgi:hypothetical protein